MKVAMYRSHHELPFWGGKHNPNCLFDPSILVDWTFEKSVSAVVDGVDCVVDKEFPASENILMPILNGLLAINMLGVMANVSLFFDHEKKSIVVPKRVWVQISTEPEEKDEQGLPIVVKDGVVQVSHLWGGDNGTCSPFELLGKELVEEKNTPEFWTKFFVEKLCEAKKKALEEANEIIVEATKTLRCYSVIP